MQSMQSMQSTSNNYNAPKNSSSKLADNTKNSIKKNEVSATENTRSKNVFDVSETQGNYIFALDIGTRTVVGMIGEYIDDKYYVRDYVVVPHTKRAMVDGQVEDIKQVAKIVASAKSQLEERTGIHLTHVAVAAAGRALRTRHVNLTFDVSDKDFLSEDVIKSMEMETIQKAQEELDAENEKKKIMFYCVGHTVINYKLDDYKILSLEGHKGQTVEIDMIAAFLPSVVVEGLYSVMELNNLEISSLTLEPIAAMNVIIPEEIRLINIALVDIGAGTSDIAIAKDGSIVAYAMATTAGDEITEEIIKTYFVDFATAEKLKLACSSGADEVEYSDIFGITHKDKADDFFAKVQPAVNTLSDTICDAIIEVNGSAPAAVFLVGGGSLVNGLTDMISERLKIDRARVAVGSHTFLKNVDAGEFQLGAEFVTPIGIGVTAVLNQGYDFSIITLNDRKIRIFDTKQLTIYELLSIAGYRSADIIGHSGRSLTYSLNGVRASIKGGMFTPASVLLNDKPASLTTKVSQGDIVKMTPAESGSNAHAKLSDIVDFAKYRSGTVTFMSEKHLFGLTVLVNGTPQKPDYDVQVLDEIETDGIFTISDLLNRLDVEMDVQLLVNDEPQDPLYLLNDGDVISYVGADGDFDEVVASQSAIHTETPAENVEKTEMIEKNLVFDEVEEKNSEEVLVGETENNPATNNITANAGTEEKSDEKIAEAAQNLDNFQPKNYPANEAWHEMVVTINGKKHLLPETADQMPHTFLELLNYVDIDPTKPQGDIELTLNNKFANFSDQLKHGDIAVIRWKERS